MSIRVLPMSELDDAAKASWATLQESQPLLDSPFFRPEFNECAAAVRDGVRVAVLDDGYLPYHRGRGDIARGAAGHLSDVEGAVLPPDSDFDAATFVDEADLKAWRFGHLIGGHPGTIRHTMAVVEHPYIDLSNGYEAYRDRKRQTRSRLFKEIERKARKAERQHAVEFTLDDRDPAALEWLVREKRTQLRAMKAWDYFTVPWTTPLFQACLQHRSRRFAGLVSTLRYDGRIVAAHIGLRSAHVLHAWTHVFDAASASLSPGMVMLCRLFEESAADGVTRIDMGRGHEGYKMRFASGSRPLAEGGVETSFLPRATRRAFFFGRDVLANTRFGPPARRAVRAVRDTVRTIRSAELQSPAIEPAEPSPA